MPRFFLFFIRIRVCEVVWQAISDTVEPLTGRTNTALGTTLVIPQNLKRIKEKRGFRVKMDGKWF
jgi:hypothetical protein